MAPEPSRFLNPIPNEARYEKSNVVTLDLVCEAAYQGDLASLDKYLRSGGEEDVFNGDLNMHLTDVSALHMASLAGHAECVGLLLEARADPHLRARVAAGLDPSGAETAKDKAAKFGHSDVVAQLEAAMQATPPGRYQPDGIGNNRRLYGDAAEVAAPPASPAEHAAEPAAAPSALDAAPPTAVVARAPVPPAERMPVALLFPGQGSQYVKMLDGVKDLPAVKDMLAKAKEILGYDLLEICLKGPEEKLAETRYCQPAMFVAGLAAMEKLRADGKADVVRGVRCVAGLSLGEYTALSAAGVLTFEDGLRLVKLRGEAMQEAAQVGKQGMVSVIGLEKGVVESLCAAAAKQAGDGGVCKIANVLFPKGFSCAGTEKAVTVLKGLAEKKDALQVKMLKTSGAFHTSLMQPARERLQVALREAAPRMQPPSCDVYMNVTGQCLPAGADAEAIVDLLDKQLVGSVLWCNIVEQMIKDGVTEFYECGPQKQLKAMMKRINNKMWSKTTSVEV